MSVRPLTVEDYDAWRTIRLEALRDAPDAFLTTAAEEEARPTEDTHAFLAKGILYGTWDGLDLSGVMAMMPETHDATRHRAWIVAVYVRPDWRGRSAADQLLMHVIALARAQGIAQLELHVSEGNARAIGFYQRHGFEICGRLPRAMRRDGRDIHELHMWRPLDTDEG